MEKLLFLVVAPLVEARRVASLAKVRTEPRVMISFGTFENVARKDLGVVGGAVWIPIGKGGGAW